MVNIIHVFTEILMPILFMVGLGAMVHRAFRLDMKTLVRINLYLFVPAFLFYRLLESQQSWLQIGASGLAITVPILLMGACILVVMRSYKAAPATISTAMVASVFFNAGNFGIPFAELAFGAEGG